ncbi:radical SAM protein [Anaerocolumna sp. AGMB13025]|uniref:radical SAM protein n=1 Tax=Anaerocolumna sp. AGMB13025 TaxID=3039116 RepID=UPI00241E6174|nr:radical SAM protein [Anaerocolumna sp. AGMB13025]WFR57887.1 radical SAM protein [Anaerocolumna sp. AGMB13025]
MSMTWEQLGGILDRKTMVKRIPLIGEFELTARCNLRCKMCYICRNTNEKEVIEKERSVTEWIRLAEEARDQGMLFLLLTGGEVFLRNDFKTLYEELSMMGFHITIFTNGTLITPAVADWLGSRMPSQMEVTLYGASPETYDRVCGDYSGFKRAMKGIELLKAQGINLQLRTTIVKENIGDYEYMEDIAKTFGSSLGIVNYISPRREGNLTSPETERLSPVELAEFENRVNENSLVSGLADQYTIEQFKESIPQGLLEKMGLKDAFPCSAGKNSFWVTWDGKMIPCSLMDKVHTYPFEQGFLRAWKDLKTQCDRVPVCKSCSKCSLQDYCTSCPASLMNETGSFMKPSSYLCELAQERKNHDYERRLIQNRS